MSRPLRATTEQLLEQAALAIKNESYKNAEQLAFQALSRKNEGTEPRLRQWFQDARQEGRLEEALAIILALTAYKPSDYLLHNQLGKIHAELKDFSSAKGSFKDALSINPKFAFARYNLAALEAKVPLYDLAAKQTIEKLRRHTGFIWPLFLSRPKGIRLQCEELLAADKAEEIEDLNKLIHKKATSYNYLDIQQALQLCEQVAVIEASAAKFDTDKGWDLIEKCRCGLESLDLSTAAGRSLESNFITLGLHYVQIQQFEQAKEIFNQLTLNANHCIYLELLCALCEAELGELACSANRLQAAQEQYPDNRYYSYNLGLCLDKQSKSNRANQYFLATGFSLKQTGGVFSPKQIQDKAETLFQRGTPHEALSHLEELDRLCRSPDSLKLLCRAYLAQGDFDFAFETAQTFEDYVCLPTEVKLQKEEKPLAEYFIETTDHLYRSNQLEPAAIGYHFTGKLTRDPSYFKLAIKLYRNLDQPSVSAKIETELRKLEATLSQEASHSKFDGLFESGKVALKNKDYQKAISSFEAALLVRGDQQVVAYLYKIYQSLNQPRALNQLIKTWKWLSEKEVGQPV